MSDGEQLIKLEGVEAEVYEDEGTWSFRVLIDGVEFCGGGGFSTAEQAMECVEPLLESYVRDALTSH